MENKQLNWFAKIYKSAVGEFDFKTLIYLASVFIVTAVLPFARPGFDLADITVMFIIITLLKMAINLQTKKMMAIHTTDKGLATNEDIVEAHKSIKDVRLEIEKQKYNRFLPKAVREENLKVDLNTLYTNINNIMVKAKVDDEIVSYQGTLENIEELLDLIENGKPYKELKLILINELTRIKKSTLTVASLYSKNDSIDRVKKYDLDIDEAIKKMTQRSAAISIGLVAVINIATFGLLGFNGDTIVQSILNTAMLIFSGVMGTDAGRKIVKQYANVVGEKLEFLKSFLTKAEHYAKPTEDELEKIKQDEKEKEAKIIQDEKDKKALDRKIAIEDLELEQQFIIKKLEIEAQTKQHEATIIASKTVEVTPTPIVKENVSANQNEVVVVLKTEK